MVSLIIPAAGKSSRFPNTKPKFLLTNPNGNTMLKDCLKHGDLRNVDTIYITILQEHFEKYLSSNFDTLDKMMNGYKCRFLILKNPTSSQCETIVNTIKFFKLKGPIFIKDVDNS
jgi:CTP:molybdopterin cytidylyltransferase MocA